VVWNTTKKEHKDKEVILKDQKGSTVCGQEPVHLSLLLEEPLLLLPVRSHHPLTQLKPQSHLAPLRGIGRKNRRPCGLHILSPCGREGKCEYGAFQPVPLTSSDIRTVLVLMPFSVAITKYLRLSTLHRQEVYLAHRSGDPRTWFQLQSRIW
jgi:hypothetical protein